jgi:hypothetical protein
MLYMGQEHVSGVDLPGSGSRWLILHRALQVVKTRLIVKPSGRQATIRTQSVLRLLFTGI